MEDKNLKEKVKNQKPKAPKTKVKAKPKNFTEELKEIEQYQQQGLQDTTKNRKKNRRKFQLLIILLLLFIVGIGVAAFFILSNLRQREIPLIVDVQTTSYRVVNGEHRAIGHDKFHFREKDVSSQHFTKGIDTTLGVYVDLEMAYIIDNKTTNTYLYTLDFSNLVMENVDIVCYIEGEEYKKYSITEENRICSINRKNDFKLIVEISLKNIGDDALCKGSMTLFLSSM